MKRSRQAVVNLSQLKVSAEYNATYLAVTRRLQMQVEAFVALESYIELDCHLHVGELSSQSPESVHHSVDHQW